MSLHTMTDGEKNKAFLDSATPELKADILDSIAQHYGTTTDVILDEVTDRDA